MQTYKATNTKTGKFYIGSTRNFEKRKAEHLRSKANLPFQNALRKCPEDFAWEVWSDDCNEPILEQALLDMWVGKKCCYNINPSAKHPPSPEGRVDTEETKKRRSRAQIGKKRSPETIEKLKVIMRNRPLPQGLVDMHINPKTGKSHPRSRPIVLINVETKEEEEFECVADAARKYGLNDGHLCATAAGKRKKHKGFRARYLDG
jgi:group I intron endonuclease